MSHCGDDDVCSMISSDGCWSESSECSMHCTEADACFESIMNEMNGLARVAYKGKRIAAYASNNISWSSNNFSNYALSNGQSNWNYGSNVAAWCSNNFSNYALSNGQSNWNYGSNVAAWCSNSFSNYALSNGQSNWNYGSNTASWTSNRLSNIPLVLHAFDSETPTASNNSSNLGNFVEVIKGPDSGAIYYVDMLGVAKMVYSPYPSNVATWGSNNFSNYALSNGQSNWNYASNAVTWLSNNLPLWSNVTTDPSPSGNPESMYGKFTYNPSTCNIHFIDYTGTARRMEGPYASNTAAYASNTATYASNSATFGSNLAQWLSNNLANWSNVTTDPLAAGNPAATYGSFTFNSSNSNIFYIDYTGTAKKVFGVVDSNYAMWASNAIPSWSNMSIATDPVDGAVTTLSPSSFVFNTATGNSFFVDYNGVTRRIENAAALTYASNTAAWASNAIPTWSNMTSTTDPADGTASLLSPGTFVYNTATGNSFYVDYARMTRRIENLAGINYASNTAAWASNAIPSWSNINTAADPTDGASSTLSPGTFVYNIATGNSFYVDYSGMTRRIENASGIKYASNTAAWASNAVPTWSNISNPTDPTDGAVSTLSPGTFVYNVATSNAFYVDYAGMTRRIENVAGLKYASNTATWASNAIPTWSNFSAATDPTSGVVSALSPGTFVYNTATSNAFYVDYSGMTRRIEGPGSESKWASNTAAWASNAIPTWSNISAATDPTDGAVSSLSPGTFVYNTATGNSFYVDYAGMTRRVENVSGMRWASNTAAWASNAIPTWSNFSAATDPADGAVSSLSPGTFVYNTATGNSFYVDYAGMTRRVENVSGMRWASNTAAWASNAIPSWININQGADPTDGAVSTLSPGSFIYNVATGNSFYVDYSGMTRRIENASGLRWASNTASWASNAIPTWSNFSAATDPTDGGVTSLSPGTFVYNTATGNSFYVDYAGMTRRIENVSGIRFASNTAIWASNAIANAGGNDDYWVYPKANFTYTMCNVGIGVSAPNQALDVNGNAEFTGSLYVRTGSGGAVFLHGSALRAGTSFPTNGIGTNSSKVTGIGGDEVRIYDTSGLIIETFAASNSTFSYPDAVRNQGGTIPYYNAGTQEIQGAPCPTVWVSCNMRIPGNCAVNTVNAWSYSGEIGLIKTVSNISADIGTCKMGTLNVGTINNTSDRRVKTDIVDANLDICYSNVANLKLKYYQYTEAVQGIGFDDRHKVGWIAQDVEQVFPKSVSYASIHGLDDCKTVSHEQIVAAMYGSIQKLQMINQQRDNEIAALRKDMDDLKVLCTFLMKSTDPSRP